MLHQLLRNKNTKGGSIMNQDSGTVTPLSHPRLPADQRRKPTLSDYLSNFEKKPQLLPENTQFEAQMSFVPVETQAMMDTNIRGGKLNEFSAAKAKHLRQRSLPQSQVNSSRNLQLNNTYQQVGLAMISQTPTNGPSSALAGRNVAHSQTRSIDKTKLSNQYQQWRRLQLKMNKQSLAHQLSTNQHQTTAFTSIQNDSINETSLNKSRIFDGLKNYQFRHQPFADTVKKQYNLSKQFKSNQVPMTPESFQESITWGKEGFPLRSIDAESTKLAQLSQFGAQMQPNSPKINFQDSIMAQQQASTIMSNDHQYSTSKGNTSEAARPHHRDSLITTQREALASAHGPAEDSIHNGSSIMSQSQYYANKELVSSRIPWKELNKTNQHNFGTQVVNAVDMSSQAGSRSSKRADTVAASEYTLGASFGVAKTPKRKFEFDQTFQMGGNDYIAQSRDVMPSAQEHAETLRSRRLNNIPEGDQKEVSNIFEQTQIGSGAKPCHPYRFRRFDRSWAKRGSPFETPPLSFACHESTQRSLVPDGKNLISKLRQDELPSLSYRQLSSKTNKIMQFRKQKIDLYEGVQPAEEDIKLQSEITSNDIPQISSPHDAGMSSNRKQSDVQMQSDNAAAEIDFIIDNIDDSMRLPDSTKYQLYHGGKEGLEQYLKDVARRIEERDPEVNMTAICEQYFNRDVIQGKPVESMLQVFWQTFKQMKNGKTTKRISLHDPQAKPSPKKKVSVKDQSPVSPNNKSPRKSAMKSPQLSSVMENDNDYEDDFPMFKLANYSLAQMKEAYKAYVDTFKILKYGLELADKHIKENKGKSQKITTHLILQNMAKNPETSHLAPIIQNPWTVALLQLRSTYVKYNFETNDERLYRNIEYKDEIPPGLPKPSKEEIDKPINLKNINPVGLAHELIRSFAQVIKDLRDPQPLEIHHQNSAGSDHKSQYNSDHEAQSPDRVSNFNPNAHAAAALESQGSYASLRSGGGNSDHRNHARRCSKDLNSEHKAPLLGQTGYYYDVTEESIKNKQAYRQVMDVVRDDVKKIVDNYPGMKIDFGAASVANSFESAETLRDAIKVATSDALIKAQNSTDGKPKVKQIIGKRKENLLNFVQSDQFLRIFTELVNSLRMSQPVQNQVEVRHATEHISTQNFYKVANDSVSSNIQTHPFVNFLNGCNKSEVLAQPIFSKIRKGELILINYHLNNGTCHAFAKFLNQTTSETFLIKSLILHQNNCSDEGISAIMDSLSKQQRVQHLHYSMNVFSTKAIASLSKILEMEFPNQLKSLVLSNLKAKNVGEKREITLRNGETEIERVSLYRLLCESLLKTETIQKLVLQGIPLCEKSGTDIAKFVAANSNLDDLQLIDCNLPPQSIAAILEELEENQKLLSLSLQGNVLIQHHTNSKVIDSIINILKEPYLMHLDISGMFLGNENVVRIAEEGVSQSKSMIAFHFFDNRVEHWSRIRIHSILTRAGTHVNDVDEEIGSVDDVKSAMSMISGETNKEKPELLAVVDMQGTPASSIAPSEAGDKIEDLTASAGQDSVVSRATPSEIKDRRARRFGSKMHGVGDKENTEFAKEIEEAHLNHILKNANRNDCLDRRLDFGFIPKRVQLDNIMHISQGNIGLLKNLPSGMIIHKDQLKQTENDNLRQQPKIGITEEMRGCLYMRASPKPELMRDKANRDIAMEGAVWQSISAADGCYICKAQYMIHKEQLKVKKRETAFAQGQTTTISDISGMNAAMNNGNALQSLFQ